MVSAYHSRLQNSSTCEHIAQGITYRLLLEYSYQLWPDVNLTDDHSIEDGIPFIATKVAQALSYICKDGIRYGCIMNAKTQSDSYTFLLAQDNSAWYPVQIYVLFVISILNKVPEVCAMVWQLHAENNIPLLP